MGTGHNHWRRILRRALEEVKATAQIAKYTTWPDAIFTFFIKAEIQIINRKGYYETPGTTKRLLKKHEIMRRYVDRLLGDLPGLYDRTLPLPAYGPELRDRIWVCWWQGLDQAPEIAKCCIGSLRRCAGEHQVTVITEENYKDYVQLPCWLEEKYKAGIISRTHFSDILRMSLLAEYGGLWLDATVFCSGPDLEACFSSPVWSVKRPDYGHISAGCGGFVTGTIRCGYEERWIFRFLRDLLFCNWEKHDLLIDYLILDYLIDYAIRHDSGISDAFAQIKPNNSQSDELLKVLNQPYNDALWQRMKQETALFILSWKRNYILENNGEETFYARLIKQAL